MSEKNEIPKIIVPEFIFDNLNNKKYKKGKFLGKGGFARCYELIDCSNNHVYAGKVISKSQLQKPDQKTKMAQEICIHRSIKHRHVVEFHKYFEDSNNIYIILELCAKRSLMEMHKRRKTLTEPEVRYIVKQVALACQYLHGRKIVHRDLKLGNLFINEDMDIKVGDFGLAAEIKSESDRKLTLCGTPNYIAPEVLLKRGHSFEADVWSLGCIVYTLVVGKPPFETKDLKETYKRIKANNYQIPQFVPPEVKHFIGKMLQFDPSLRPTMTEILADSYMTINYIPSKLPQSCLTMSPRYNNGRLSIMPSDLNLFERKPLRSMNQDSNSRSAAACTVKYDSSPPPVTSHVNCSKDFHLKELKKQLQILIESKPEEIGGNCHDEAEHPASTPIIWISRWVDYTDRYGIGYQLCDNSIGILFNDVTRILLLADGQTLQYINKDGTEDFHAMESYPETLKKKVILLKYFKNYMNEHLVKCGEKIQTKEEDELTRLPYLNKWFRTKNAIVFQLTNGTVQLNFFEDHTKIILCPHMGAVTYIDKEGTFRTFKFSLMKTYGCSRELAARLKYALEVVERLVIHKTGPRNVTGVLYHRNKKGFWAEIPRI